MQPKKVNILIPNGTGPTNIGDQAILVPLIEIIRDVYPDSFLTLHSSDPKKYREKIYKEKIANRIDNTLYSWAVFDNRNALVRGYKVLVLLLSFWLLKYNIHFHHNKHLDSLISDYKKADLIVFAGGGYLRSQKGLTQTLNLLMIYLLFQFAKLTQARKIIAPLSFGPFAYKWQEKLCARGLNGFDTVALREHISYDLLSSYKIKNLIKSVDTALLLKPNHHSFKKNKLILGFTIRQWLDKKNQETFEEDFTNAIVKFARETGVSVQPIVQVDAPQYGDIDFSITENIAEKLRKAKIKTSPIKKVNSLESADRIYSKISLLLGMRMHSNILAAIQKTPFVAISYEHKTDGIVKDLGLDKYYIKLKDVNEKKLLNKLNLAFINLKKLKIILNTSLVLIQKKETARWMKILAVRN